MVSLFGRGFESLQLHPKKRTWHLICQVLFLYHAKEGQMMDVYFGFTTLDVHNIKMVKYLMRKHDLCQ